MTSRILIIEDDLDFAGQLKTLSESEGYHAEVALTGAEGVHKFRSWAPDLVLLDLKLPNGHGLRVAQELRTLPKGSDVPIFLMSAVYKRRALLEQDMLLLGINTYLLKPFSFDDLVRRIGGLAGGEEFGRAAVRLRLVGRTQRSGRAYARAESSPSELPQALSEKKVALEAEDTMLLADSARRLPRAGEMRPDIWVRILTTVFHSHSNGVVVRKIGDKRRSIYFLNGYPVWAEGPSPAEGILRFFRVEGVLDGASAELVAADLADGDMSLRGLMMATGKVTEEQLDGLFEDWVAEEVRNTLRHRGEFEFVRTEDFAGKIPIFEVNPIPTLWEGLEDALGSIEIRAALDELAGRKLGRTRNFKKMFGYIGAASTLQGVGEMLDHGPVFHGRRHAEDVYIRHREVICPRRPVDEERHVGPRGQRKHLHLRRQTVSHSAKDVCLLREKLFQVRLEVEELLVGESRLRAEDARDSRAPMVVVACAHLAAVDREELRGHLEE